MRIEDFELIKPISKGAFGSGKFSLVWSKKIAISQFISESNVLMLDGFDTPSKSWTKAIW